MEEIDNETRMIVGSERKNQLHDKMKEKQIFGGARRRLRISMRIRFIDEVAQSMRITLSLTKHFSVQSILLIRLEDDDEDDYDDDYRKFPLLDSISIKLDGETLQMNPRRYNNSRLSFAHPKSGKKKLLKGIHNQFY